MMDATERFHGTIVIVAPHMDDEILACGGLMAKLRHKENIHVIYATDGMRSPAPVIPWRDAITPDLGELRMRESERATGFLGIPHENLHFLGLPDARLNENLSELTELLLEHLERLNPDHVLIPFRYDRHPDHLAINHVITAARRNGCCKAELTEYFVYYRWRLLPRRDIRKYIRHNYVLEIDIDDVAALKRTALAFFETQTTRFYPWQTRPILTEQLLDEECIGPEIFLRVDPRIAGPAVFTGLLTWIRIMHRLEPRLQKWKSLLKYTLFRNAERRP